VGDTEHEKDAPPGRVFVCSGRGASQHGKRDVMSRFPCWGGRRGGAGEGGPANARNASKAMFQVLGWKQKEGGPLNTQNTPMWRVLGVQHESRGKEDNKPIEHTQKGMFDGFVVKGG